MAQDINFLTVKKKGKAEKKKGLLIARIVAVGYLVLIGLLSILAFYLSNRLSLDTAKKNENSFLRTIAPFKGSEAKLLLIKDRIANISEILERREEVTGREKAKKANYEKVITSFKEKIPQGIVVNSLNVDESKVVLNLSSDSLILVDDLINGLSSLGQDKIVRMLLLESLSLSEQTNTYLVLFTATL